MRQHLYEKEQMIEELQEQLYFYRAVIAPEDGNTDLSIFSVSLQPIEKRRMYSLELVLRSHAVNKGAMKGRVDVSVEGTAIAENKELMRDDLLVAELHFSFKYFQRLKGLLRLPDGFVPQRLNISVESGRSKGFENIYDWNGLILNKTSGS